MVPLPEIAESLRAVSWQSVRTPLPCPTPQILTLSPDLPSTPVKNLSLAMPQRQKNLIPNITTTQDAQNICQFQKFGKSWPGILARFGTEDTTAVVSLWCKQNEGTFGILRHEIDRGGVCCVCTQQLRRVSPLDSSYNQRQLKPVRWLPCQCRSKWQEMEKASVGSWALTCAGAVVVEEGKCPALETWVARLAKSRRLLEPPTS